MAATNTWRLYCETEGDYVLVDLDDSAPAPTECPNNTEHTVTADSACITDTVAHKTRVFPPLFDGSYGCYKTKLVKMMTNMPIPFEVPNDFGRLVSLKLVGIVLKDAAVAGRQYLIAYSEYGADGENYNQKSHAAAYLQDLVGKADRVMKFDISSVATSLVAGDVGSIRCLGYFTGTIHFTSLELVYEVK